MILGASILQLPAIKQAKAMGLDVVAVDMNPDAIGFKEEGIEKEIISTIDIPGVLEAARKHKINGIMTLASDMPMRTVAAVAKEMDLVGIDEQTAIRATNKYEMRKALKKAGVPIPAFSKVSSFDELEECIKQFKGKFITKPADNSGSRGIFLVDDISKVREAFEYSKANSRNGDVVVEEFMEGPEVSVETLTIDGVCHVIQITDKLTTGAPHFVEMGHSQPSQLDQCVQERIKNVAIAANKAIGIQNGPSHTEIIVTNEGPKIVELGARLGGGCITTHLVPFSTGIDIVMETIKLSLGEKPEIIPQYQKGSAIRYFNIPTGIIMNIDGIEEARKIVNIQEVTIFKQPGDRVDNITCCTDRAGYVISMANSAIEAIQACEDAINQVSFEIM